MAPPGPRLGTILFLLSLCDEPTGVKCVLQLFSSPELLINKNWATLHCLLLPFRYRADSMPPFFSPYAENIHVLLATVLRELLWELWRGAMKLLIWHGQGRTGGKKCQAHPIHGTLPTQCIALIDQLLAYLEISEHYLERFEITSYLLFFNNIWLHQFTCMDTWNKIILLL